MKLVRYGKPGKEKPGLIDMDGRIRDLSEVVGDIGGDTLSPKALRKIARLRPGNLPLVRGKPRLGSCVARPGNFIAIGLNYADHAAEAGAKIPAEPIVFMKATNCVVGPNDDIMIPKGSTKTDWEVELAIVIGTGGSHIAERNALEHVAGYCICNDVSERAYQIERSGQWMKGKSLPTFGPVGPWLVTSDEAGDVQNLKMWLKLNDQYVQNGSSKTMIFNCQFLVHYISQFMHLDAGDIITTGTPPGVGLGMKPPLFLKGGDTMEVGIEGLGVQHQHVKQA